MTALTIDSATEPSQTTQAIPAKKKRSLLRYALYGGSFALVAVFVANIAWTMSGSGKWVQEIDRNGVKVYSLKAPGAYNTQFKAVMRGKYSLNQLVGGLIENSTIDNCKKNIPDCVDVKVISPWSAKTMSDTVLWKLALPDPFMPREMVMRSQVSQDPTSKTVTVDLLAAPSSAPRNADSVRLTHIQNRWRYTPVGKDEVEIEFLQDFDMGGMFPTILINLAGAEETYKFIHDQLPALVNTEKLRAIKYDFIAEGNQ